MRARPSAADHWRLACHPSPSVDWIDLGAGRCGGATPGDAPEVTATTFAACRARADADAAVVAFECSGGYPSACACRLYTGAPDSWAATNATGSRCLVRKRGADACLARETGGAGLGWGGLSWVLAGNGSSSARVADGWRTPSVSEWAGRPTLQELADLATGNLSGCALLWRFEPRHRFTLRMG